MKGIGLMEIEKEKKKRYQKCFSKSEIANLLPLELAVYTDGERSGEKHMFNQRLFQNCNRPYD
jgi:glutamate synthase (ferredoxin)